MWDDLKRSLADWIYGHGLHIVMVWLAIILVLAAALAFGAWKPVAHADDFATHVMVADQGDRIVLEQTLCAAEARLLFPQSTQPKTATYVWMEKRQLIAGCWMLYQDWVFAAFDDGDRYRLDPAVFKVGTVTAKEL